MEKGLVMDVFSQLSESDALTLSSAVLLYTGTSRNPYQSPGKLPEPGQALAMICDALPVPGKAPILGPGRMVTRDTLDAMVRALDGLPQSRQMLPESVLLADGGRLAWWVPSARRPIFFGERVGTLGRDLAGRLPWHPALLFVAEAGRLVVHALANSERPGPKTPLFVAPYFNLWAGGHMCNGNVRMPQSLSPADMAKWETAFFETTFTHANGGVGELTKHPKKHDGLWRECASEECAAFPVRFLVPQTRGGQHGQRPPLKGARPVQITAEMAVCG